MSDNIMYVLGFIAGILFVAVISIIITLICKKKNKPMEYDERQVLARGAAYSAAFGSTIVYMMGCALLDALEIKWAELNVQMFFGAFFAVAVFASICIFKDAYFSFNSKKAFMAAIFGFVMAVNIFVVVMSIIDGETFITNGMLNRNCNNIAIAVVFAEILISIIIKSIIDRKSVEEE